jgi:hypothetical protein
MEELLAWDGVWSQDLINLMVRVAEEIEVTRDERQFSTISALFSQDGPRKLGEWISQVRRKVEEAQLAARGEVWQGRAPQRFLEAFGVED